MLRSNVSEEDDSEEDLYWSTIELLRDPIAQTVNANRYATPSSSRCWGEAAQLDGKNYPVEKTEAGEWHSTKGCHQCIRQVILVIGLNSVPARLAKFSGHVGILPMPIHAAASKQDKRASRCFNSKCHGFWDTLSRGGVVPTTAMFHHGRRMYLCEHPTELYSFAEDIDVESIRVQCLQ